MVDVTLPSISSATDETIVALDRLHQTGQARRAGHLARLQASVDRLEFSPSPDPEPEQRRERPRPEVTNPGPSFVPLPRRTTHGGPFGPVVREKLRAAALEKESRRW